MVNLNFNEKDKALIVEAENRRGYVYYEFTEEKIRDVAAKPVQSIEYEDWCCLLQMLYPRGLISSGLFEPFLVFEIVNSRRKDPPKEHWGCLAHPGSAGTLLERFIFALAEHGIEVHESWHTALSIAKKQDKRERKG